MMVIVNNKIRIVNGKVLLLKKEFGRNSIGGAEFIRKFCRKGVAVTDELDLFLQLKIPIV